MFLEELINVNNLLLFSVVMVETNSLHYYAENAITVIPRDE